MKTAESCAEQALRNVLEKIQILQIVGIQTEAGSSDWEPDLIVQLRVNRRSHRLVCAYTSNGQPRFARSALLEMRDYVANRAPDATPILIGPYFSPAVRQMCHDKEVGYLDLLGNTRIAFEGVYIERTSVDKPVTEQRELKSLFSPKSAQVLRVMLRDPQRAWRLTKLSEISGVSLGHVSNVRASLIDRDWACASADGLVLSDPDVLLDAWRDHYKGVRGERLRFYSPLHGRGLDDAARQALGARDRSGRVAFASFSAAQWLAPYGRTGTHYFMADADGLRMLQVALKLSPALQGENVVVTVPIDPGPIADTIEPAPGAVCTSLVQTYLDLAIAGERGLEAARHLRQARLSWSE